MNLRSKKLIGFVLMLTLLFQVVNVLAGGKAEVGDWLEYTFFDADKRDAP